MAALSWPVYRGNFTKDSMGVRQGNELLAGLERVAFIGGRFRRFHCTFINNHCKL